MIPTNLSWPNCEEIMKIRMNKKKNRIIINNQSSKVDAGRMFEYVPYENSNTSFMGHCYSDVGVHVSNCTRS